MFEKFLNKHVIISVLGPDWTEGILTRVDENFIELENKGISTVVQIKYITKIRNKK